MDELLHKTRRWTLSLALLTMKGLPSAFIICSLELIAPEKQLFYCVDEFGLRRHNGMDQCHFTSIDSNDKISCTAWDFDSKESFTSEFNAVCDRKWLRAWAQSGLMIGMMVGNFLISHISDWYGRKTACILGTTCVLLAGIAGSFATTFPLWVAYRVIMATGLGGNQNAFFTLAVESTNPRHRASLGVADLIGWVVGLIVLPIFPLFINDWHFLQFTISLSVIPLLLLLMMTDESPRWLIANGEIDKAKNVIRRIVKRNKLLIAECEMDAAISQCLREHNEALTERKPTLIDLYRTPKRAVETLCFNLQHSLKIFIYYNLLYTIIATDTAGVFSSQLWTGLSEIPSLILLFIVIKYYKRKNLHFILSSISIICCIIILQFPDLGTIVKFILATIAKLGVQVDISVIIVHLNETYPTKIRGIAYGTCLTVSRIGAVISPFCHEQDVVDGNLINSISGLLCLLLVIPQRETFGKPLPENFIDADDNQIKL